MSCVCKSDLDKITCHACTSRIWTKFVTSRSNIKRKEIVQIFTKPDLLPRPLVSLNVAWAAVSSPFFGPWWLMRNLNRNMWIDNGHLPWDPLKQIYLTQTHTHCLLDFVPWLLELVRIWHQKVKFSLGDGEVSKIGQKNEGRWGSHAELKIWGGSGMWQLTGEWFYTLTLTVIFGHAVETICGEGNYGNHFGDGASKTGIRIDNLLGSLFHPKTQFLTQSSIPR